METITKTDSTIQPDTNANYYNAIMPNEIGISQQEAFFNNVWVSLPASMTISRIGDFAKVIGSLSIGGSAVFNFGANAAFQLVTHKSTTSSFEVYFADMGGIAGAVATGQAITPYVKGGMAFVGVAGAPAAILTYAVTSFIGYCIMTEANNWGQYIANYNENFYIYNDIATNQKGLVIKYNTTDINSIKTQLNNSGFLGFDKNIDLIVEDGAGKRYEVIREDEYGEILTELQRRGFVDPTYLGADIHELFGDNPGLESQWSR